MTPASTTDYQGYEVPRPLVDELEQMEDGCDSKAKMIAATWEG